jgi:3-oxoadipate enol-lactonase
MPGKNVGTVELYYELDGGGTDTVALINGIGMTVQSWQPIRERFIANGYRCLLHDCRGQLRSGKPAQSPYSMELHTADFLSLLDALDIERAHLVGTSYGSEIGMVFAFAHPERTASLTVIAGVSELDSLMRAAADSWAVAADCGAVPFFRCMLPWAYSSEFLARNRQLLNAQEEAMTRLPPDYFAAFKRLVDAFLQLDITGDLKRIRCPTLVVSAEKDLIKGPPFGRMIHDNIAESEFEVIPGAGHAVVLEQPDLVATRVIDFLDRHPVAKV